MTNLLRKTHPKFFFSVPPFIQFACFTSFFILTMRCSFYLDSFSGNTFEFGTSNLDQLARMLVYVFLSSWFLKRNNNQLFCLCSSNLIELVCTAKICTMFSLKSKLSRSKEESCFVHFFFTVLGKTALKPLINLLEWKAIIHYLVINICFLNSKGKL